MPPSCCLERMTPWGSGSSVLSSSSLFVPIPLSSAPRRSSSAFSFRVGTRRLNRGPRAARIPYSHKLWASASRTTCPKVYTRTIVRRRNKAERTPRTVSSSAVHTRDSTPVPTTHSRLAPGRANATAPVSRQGFACMAALSLSPSMISTLSVCVQTRSATRAPVRPCRSPWQRTTTGACAVSVYLMAGNRGNG